MSYHIESIHESNTSGLSCCLTQRFLRAFLIIELWRRNWTRIAWFHSLPLSLLEIRFLQRNLALSAPSRTVFVEICLPCGDPAQLVVRCRWLCNSGVYCEEVQFLLDLVFTSNKDNILFPFFQHLYFMYSYFTLGWERDIFPGGKCWRTCSLLPSYL